MIMFLRALSMRNCMANAKKEANMETTGRFLQTHTGIAISCPRLFSNRIL